MVWSGRFLGLVGSGWAWLGLVELLGWAWLNCLGLVGPGWPWLALVGMPVAGCWAAWLSGWLAGWIGGAGAVCLQQACANIFCRDMAANLCDRLVSAGKIEL